MTPEEFRAYGYAAVDWIAHYLENSRAYPVLPQVEPGSLVDLLPKQGPEEAEDFATVMEDFEREIFPRNTQWNHPRFMGYFAISGAPPGIIAELLCAALNSNGMLWKSSPASTELEQVTLDWLRQWMALPEGWFGQILDTASTSTFHAVVAARVRKGHKCADESLTLYASEFAHSSVPKAAYAAGIAKENVRFIGTDEAFRMRPELLEQAIEEDLRNGKVPFCVVATVGTTSVASIDPVAEVGEIARRHGLWLHVDGAYGASAAIDAKYQWTLDGVAEADSLVVNPHKWLLTPVDISVLYCREAEWMRQAFSLVPEYLRTAQDPRALNYNEYGLPLGRRFRALKLWFTMRAYGRQGLAAVIDNHIQWAKRLRGLIEANGNWEIVAPVEFSLVVFRHKAGDAKTKAILDRVNESGTALVSPDVLRGRQAIRLAIGNWQTTWADVEAAWEATQEAERELGSDSSN
jgi:aromatic-L-amino-acid decarboxylase